MRLDLGVEVGGTLAVGTDVLLISGGAFDRRRVDISHLKSAGVGTITEITSPDDRRNAISVRWALTQKTTRHSKTDLGKLLS